MSALSRFLASGDLVEPAPADFPNRLLEPAPWRPRLPARPMLLAALVLVCLAPRAFWAWQIPGICPDAVVYIDQARAWEAGQRSANPSGLRLQAYSAILLVLHRAGLDWEAAGELWGVAMASLTVLPLFGWVRRQFDDRTAIVACLLYALHPKLIAWSPEIIRDPTFWLLFMLAVYFLWRGVTEVRLRWLALGGVSIALASAMRFEGALLAIPLTLWALWRYRALPGTRGGGTGGGQSPFSSGRLSGETIRSATKKGTVPGLTSHTFPLSDRGRLVLGAGGLLAVPLVALAVLALRGHAPDLAKIKPVVEARVWLASLGGEAPRPDPELGPGFDGRSVGLPWTRTINVLVATMTRGLTPVFALLMFGGMWGWRRVWARRDLQPLFYVCLAVLAGTALDLWYVQVSCPRYAFTIVLLGSPFAALGLLGLRDRCLRFAERRRLSAAGRGLAAAIPALALVLPLGELASKGYAHRGVEADLGHWLRSQFGPQRTLVGPAGVTHAVSYYADARCVVFPFEADAATVSSMVKRYRPDIVLLRPSRRIAAEEWDPLLARLRRLGFAEACPNPLPDGYRSLRVLVPATGTTLGGKDQPGPATSKRTAWSMTTHGSRPPPPAAPPRGACSPGASRSSTGPRRRARA